MSNIRKILKKIPTSFYRFLLIGGSATVIDFIIYIFISNYLDIKISKALSTSLASIYSFILNKKWTFTDESKLSSFQVVKYIIVQIINILVNTTINTITYQFTSMKVISFIIATSISMMVNYILQRIVVFKEKNKPIN